MIEWSNSHVRGVYRMHKHDVVLPNDESVLRLHDSIIYRRDRHFIRMQNKLRRELSARSVTSNQLERR